MTGIICTIIFLPGIFVEFDSPTHKLGDPLPKPAKVEDKTKNGKVNFFGKKEREREEKL